MTLEPLLNNHMAISTRADAAVTIAREMIVSDDRTRMTAGDFIKLVKNLQTEVKKDREDERIKAKATLDAIVAGRNRHLLPLQQAEALVKQKVLAYEEAEDKRRREEQAELERKAQEEAEQAALLHAIELEESGRVEEAAAVLEAPIEAAPLVLPDLKPKVTGQHTVTLWKCRLTSINELIQAVVDGKVTVDYLQINQVHANAEVKRLKEQFKVPGVESYTEKTLASTSWK